ncbi:protein IMPACT isoform X3 [Takifugu flavidus]|uniref:protein IMPACT isoform X3 n=1 Tax=Takifugu flavidus TaxID=433684 RepID=UPI0025446C23|nr:protein IMPACT isoform X3 [Takifugu flavidus]
MADVINTENEDLQAQIEEIEALSSIYGEEWCVIDEAARIFCIRICNGLEKPKLTACLQIILPHEYPSTSPPIYQINAAWLRGSERAKLANSLEDLYVENMGESILYLWVEKVREFLVERSQSAETVDQPEKVNMTAEEDVEDDTQVPDIRTFSDSAEESHLYAERVNDEELPPIKHGESITDRRSTFQPHLAPVVSPRQTQLSSRAQMNQSVSHLLQLHHVLGSTKVKRDEKNTNFCVRPAVCRYVVIRSPFCFK